jgi:DnaK suppressor protein
MLTEREIARFKNQLERMKQEMLEVIEANQSSSFEDYGELTAFDNHFADTASQLEDREVQYSIKDTAQHILDQVNEALDRIDKGTFGKCVDTGKDIPIDRLEALPYAKRTVEAQERFDKAGEASPQIKLSFDTPAHDERGDERLQTVDELEYEHGNSSYRNQ